MTKMSVNAISLAIVLTIITVLLISYCPRCTLAYRIQDWMFLNNVFMNQTTMHNFGLHGDEAIIVFRKDGKQDVR